MKAQLEVAVSTRSFERIEIDLAVACFFEDERPLRGAAGRIDWRLCGLVSEQIEAGRIAGRVGECLLVPGSGTLRTPRVMLLGLGPRRSFDAAQAFAAGREAVRRCLSLSLSELALAPPALRSRDLAAYAEAVLAGALEAVRKARAPLSMTLVVPREEAARVSRVLEAAAQTGGHADLRIAPAPIDPRVDPEAPEGSGAPGGGPGSRSRLGSAASGSF